MNLNSLLRDNSISDSDVIKRIYEEALIDAHAYAMCSALDEGLDPGDAADAADRSLLDL